MNSHILSDTMDDIEWFDFLLSTNTLNENEVALYREALLVFEKLVCEEQGVKCQRNVLKDMSTATELGELSSSALDLLLKMQDKILSGIPC